MLPWLRSRLRLNKHYREEGVFFCFLSNTPQVRDLTDELGNYRGRGLLPLKLQLLRVLLLTSHEHTLLLELHLAEDIITRYSSHTRNNPTTSMDFFDSRVLHKFANVIGSHTSSRHDLELVSRQLLHLSDCILSLHHGITLHIK